jgi:hypothetical protein
MLGVQRAAELANALLHIGALSGAAVMLAEQRMGEALWLALVGTACILLLTGASVVAEVGRIRVRQYVRKHEERSLKPPDKNNPTA